MRGGHAIPNIRLLNYPLLPSRVLHLNTPLLFLPRAA